MEQKKQNILLLVQEYGQGGAEKVAYMLADMFRESGDFNVTLCALYAPEMPQEQVPVPRRTLGMKRTGSRLGKLRNQAKAMVNLRRLKKELRTDVTISSLWPCDRLSAYTGKERKVAIIQINILNNPQNAWMEANPDKVRAAYQRIDRIVLGGANLWEEMTGFFKIPKEKLRVVLNPINAAVIERNMAEPLPPRLEALLKNHKVFTAANRLAEIKNTVALVRIYKSLPAGSATRFLIIGEGEEKPAIEAAIREAGLTHTNIEDEAFNAEADIFFLRFQKNIHNILSRSACFVFPTMGEGLPLALIEAMYCAIPILASDCPNGGIFELMQGAGAYDAEHPRRTPERTAAGYLMPVPTDAETDKMWAEKVGELLSAGAETLTQMSTAARARAKDFDMPVTRQHWLQLLNGLPAKNK